MISRYKISDLAKDFNMSSKDVIALVTELTGEEKKSSTVLIEAEIAMVFDALTKKNAVKSFDAYFAAGNEAREKAKNAAKAEMDKLDQIKKRYNERYDIYVKTADKTVDASTDIDGVANTILRSL